MCVPKIAKIFYVLWAAKAANVRVDVTFTPPDTPVHSSNPPALQSLLPASLPLPPP